MLSHTISKAELNILCETFNFNKESLSNTKKTTNEFFDLRKQGK